MQLSNMEQKIDKLLNLLDGDSTRRKLNQVRYDYEIGKEAIEKAKLLGYVRYYNEENQTYTNILHDQYFCKITEEGSRLLNRYGGCQKMRESDENRKENEKKCSMQQWKH